MTWLRITPWSHRRAGRCPGDRSGLSRARLDYANRRQPEAFLPGSRTAVARGSPHVSPDTGTRSRCDRMARPVSPPSPSINSHTTAPAPRFCPKDL